MTYVYAIIVELKAYEESKSLLDEIKTLRRNLEEETTLDVTRVLKELGRSYDEDLKVHNNYFSLN